MTKIFISEFNSCRACPIVRKAQDDKGYLWLICPQLERVVGGGEIPEDCNPTRKDNKMSKSLAIMQKETFQTLIETIGTVCSECRLVIDETGISTKVVDTANVAMVVASLQNTYYQGDLQPKTIGLDLVPVKTMFKPEPECPAKITMALSVDDSGQYDENDKLILSTDTTVCAIRLANPNTIRKEPNVPKIDLPVKCSVNGDHIYNAIKEVRRVSDWVRFELDDQFRLIGAADNARIIKKIPCITQNRKKVSARYSVDYLVDISAAMRGTDVEISMNEDHPVSFLFMKNGVFAQILLAPRINEEETAKEVKAWKDME